MIDPEVVVLGGSMSAHTELLLPMLEKGKLQLLCLRPPTVRGSTLGADSAALGAVCLALEQVDTALLHHRRGPARPPGAPRQLAPAAVAARTLPTQGVPGVGPVCWERPLGG